MADELQNALDKLVDLLAEIPGLRTVSDRAPENVSAFPLLVASPQSGTWEPQSAGMAKGLHSIQVGCYVPRKDLPRDIATILPYGDLIKDKLFAAGNTFWTNTIDNVVEEISYTFGPIDYAELLLIGWTITIPIKIESVESSGVFSK